MLTEQSKHHVQNVKNRILCIEKESLAGIQSPTICVVSRDCFRSQRRPKSSQQNAPVSQQEEPANCGIIVANVSTISVNPSSSSRSSSNRSKSTPPVVSHSGKMNALSSANIRMDHHVFQRESGVGRNSWIIPHGLLTSRLDARTTLIFPDLAHRFLAI